MVPHRYVCRQEEWNWYEVSLMGSRLCVHLNGAWIQELDRSTESAVVQCLDGSAGSWPFTCLSVPVP